MFKRLMRTRSWFELKNQIKGGMAIFGIGGKNPACLWPVDRYEELGRMLVEKWNIFPIWGIKFPNS
jgi:ADP-heptose:LPS heptosyltransferase